MTKVLLGSIIGAVLTQAVKATRLLLDFIYLSQYLSYSDKILQYLDKALQAFYNEKKVFQDLVLEINFDISKLHSLLHFSQSIQLFRITDNYNTKQFK